MLNHLQNNNNSIVRRISEEAYKGLNCDSGLNNVHAEKTYVRDVDVSGGVADAEDGHAHRLASEPVPVLQLQQETHKDY